MSEIRQMMEQWHEAKYTEMKHGGTPLVCIMGHHTHAAFMGMLELLYQGSPQPMPDRYSGRKEVYFQGIRILQTKTHEVGMWFGTEELS